jgi:NifU-like protein involved in Fe-S cluster formation
MGKFSEIMMDHVLSPRNGGFMEQPDLTGRAGTPGRGAFMLLFLRVEKSRIVAARCHTVECGPTIACGSMLSELVLGNSIAECDDLTAEDLTTMLDISRIVRRWRSARSAMRLRTGKERDV